MKDEFINKDIIPLFERYIKKEIIQDELILLLDEIFVRGGFNQNEFLGYDYKNQEWIELIIKDNQTLETIK